MQADALARILEETATKDDLRVLEAKLTAEFHKAIGELRADLMRWAITLILAQAVLFTLLDLLVD